MVRRQLLLETPLALRIKGLIQSVGSTEMKSVAESCSITFSPDMGLTIICPSAKIAQQLYEKFDRSLIRCVQAAINAENIDEIYLRWPADRGRPLALSMSDPTPSSPQMSAWGYPHLPRNAESEQILDFIKANQTSHDKGGLGLVVTVTSMESHKCLSANSLQALDRGGGWSTHDWIGTPFLHLWRDSFCPGRTNYLSQLLSLLERDWSIQDFYYQIRRPSGALGEYWTTYYLLDEFMGCGPVRVAVSKPGAWNIVEGEE